MAVRIRLKKLGRLHRPYYRICVMDSRTPRDGKSIEEIGTYDPMVRDKDKRVTLMAERVDYWIGVGALPTEKVKVLIDKYKGKVPDKRVDERVMRELPPLPPPRERRPKITVERIEPAEPAVEKGAAEAPAEAAVAPEAAPATAEAVATEEKPAT